MAARALGGEADFYRVGAGAGWAFALLGGYQSAGVSWGARIQGGRMIDHTYSAGFYLVSPVIARTVRVVADGNASVRLDDTQHVLYTLGADSGLRGYVIGDLRGQSYLLGHVEARTMPLPVASLRLGAVTFLDVGDADTPPSGTGTALARAFRSLGALHPKSDVGLGIRLLIPQFNTYVLRVDWAVPLESTERTHAGHGRFQAAFRQVF